MKYIFFTIVLLRSTFAFAQTKDSTKQVIDVVMPSESISADPADKDQIFIVVEQSPEYPGGMTKLMEFIKANLKYPPKAQPGVEGKVFVGFVVEPDGSITEVKTIKGLGPEFDAEAERVIGLTGKWKPGKQNGKPVRVKFVIPVSFKADQSDKK